MSNHRQSREEQIKNKDRGRNSAKNNVQVSRYISEGNPNTQEGSPPSRISNDQQEANEVKQAIKNDQLLSDVAGCIQVSVNDGDITLDGQVSNKQQLNLATNTATAVGMVDKVNNRIEIIHH